MAIIAPVPLTALPTPPSTASPADFDAKADAFLGAFPTLQAEEDALAAVNYANALAAQESANTAAAQANTAAGHASAAATAAAAAAAAAGAPMWVSGTYYAFGAPAWSPGNRLVYRRIVAGAGTTDPRDDPANWAAPPGTLGYPIIPVTGTSVTAVANAHYILFNPAPTTVTLPPSPIDGDTVLVTPANGLATNSVARNGKTIGEKAEDMTIDSSTRTALLRYVDFTPVTWRCIA